MAGIFQTSVFQESVFQVDVVSGGLHVFQCNVFQQDVFQNTCTPMGPGHIFQCNVFQQNVFQNTCTPAPVEHVFQCDVFQQNVFQNTCGIVVTPQPSRQPGGDDAAGFYYDHWRKLREAQRRLKKRCEEDEYCPEILEDAVRATDAVLAGLEADASAAHIRRLQAALEDAADARRLDTTRRHVQRIYKELMALNAELMRVRAEEEEEEEAIALLMLH